MSTAPYMYTPAKTSADHEFDAPPPHFYQANDHIPEDEAFNHHNVQHPNPYSDDPPHKLADEEAGYRAVNDASDVSLVPNAAAVAGTTGTRFQNLEYSENDTTPPVEKGNVLNRFGIQRNSLQQRIDNKKRGIGRQRYPFVVWALSVAMVVVFIIELVANNKAQGSPVSFKPVVNYMLGPSGSVLVNVGARFTPCMKFTDLMPPSTPIGCTNNTENPAPPDQVCTVADICGFGGFPPDKPNQSFRFVTPIFLHAGFVHIILNLLAQLTVSAQVEREMGSGGFLLTYVSAGIFGNVLGANFALVGRPSVGASGAIFGTIAVTWVDLFAHWAYHYRPARKLAFMAVELVIGVAVGFIPFVDNFAHLGGFLMALLVGTTFLPVISETKRHRLIMTAARIIAIPIAVILFVVLIRNFYTSDPYAACQWCRYISCFPTNSNNHCKGTGLTTS